MTELGLASKLPNEYEYLEVETSPDLSQIRVKNIKSAEDASTWLDEYSEITMSTWRVGTTYPHAGKINVYRKEFRCQHRTDRRRRSQQSRSSKNTNCPAKIEIVIRRLVNYSRAKDVKLLSEFPTRITFRKNHNHATSDAEALKHRDMSDDTREKLFSLFRAGHGPSSARNYLKMELFINDRDNYDEKVADARYIPSTSVVSKLHKSVVRDCDESAVVGLCTKVTARELKAMLGQVAPTTRPRWPTRPRTTKKRRQVVGEEMVDEDNGVTAAAADDVTDLADRCAEHCDDTGSVVSDVEEHVDNLPMTADWCVGVVDSFSARIKQAIASQPDSFIPAVMAMHRNVSQFADNDDALLSAVYSIGYPTLVPSSFE